MKLQIRICNKLKSKKHYSIYSKVCSGAVFLKKIEDTAKSTGLCWSSLKIIVVNLNGVMIISLSKYTVLGRKSGKVSRVESEENFWAKYSASSEKYNNIWIYTFLAWRVLGSVRLYCPRHTTSLGGLCDS